MIGDLLTSGAKAGDIRDDVAPDELASYCLHALTAASSLLPKSAVRRLVAVDALLAGRSLIARVFHPLFRVVSRSWHMYPIGFLFGLGFDTATEIGLLGISAAQGMSFWTTLVFPALFTAAMSVMDTTDSVLMTSAYGWAFVNPIRKLWYNLTITAASVVVAIFIGGIEALGLIGDKLGLQGGLWNFVGGLNDNLANFGYAVVVIFLASWVISTVVYQVKGYDNLQVRNP